MHKEELKIVTCQGNEDHIVYFCSHEEKIEVLREYGVQSTIHAVSGFDWNRHMSPWYAEKIFAKGEDFAGEADELIQLLQEYLPAEKKGRWFCAGYSLAGLFALYLCTKTDFFDGCVSASGSLWYPGFTEYLSKHPVHCSAVYLSLGDKEKKTKNPIMNKVEDCTLAVKEIINTYAHAYFESNPGNHFNQPDLRTAKGMKYIETYGR